MDEHGELDAIHEHNRRSWEAFIGAPLDEVLAALSEDEARAALAILKPALERKRRDADRN
ncbi:hypothetical protein [Mycobacterium sp. 29Ha]|uniref:hypothetical protein n=1 Tax=Mycobacterium sp. 29Ha TaxID=2939268 RepID=UPI002939087E|nr:hypothetical protein [Mycobacterium sp. 29Ha]MDV3133320.1 hypothetical protein [Mycobacterium sp. 29Ha]